MTDEEITGLVTEMGSIMRALEGASPADKAGIYQRLGLTLTYHPQEKRVAAEARPKFDHVRKRVSKAGVEPIAHTGFIALARSFVLGMPSDGG